MEGQTLAEVCESYGLTPAALRGLLEEYGDALPVVESNGQRLLTPEAVAALNVILEARSAGLSPDAVHARLRAQDAAAAGEESPVSNADLPPAVLLAELRRISQELSRSERSRSEDRDRLMMALVRTQQEIQHLRYEVAAARSRKERKPGLLRRWLGR